MSRDSILLLGESGVGKTHFGAQLLRRLMKGDGRLRMSGQATNLEPFESALESLNEGKAAGHTATSTYMDSIWPVADVAGHQAELVWPDYGGEQIKSMISSRRVSNAWQSRVRQAPAWLLLIRLQQTRFGEDIFSRPLGDLRGAAIENRELQISDQARLIELLQMLVFVGGAATGRQADRPRLGVLLTCWDELDFDGTPAAALEERLPMLAAFVRSTWYAPSIVGLSALGRPLSPHDRDSDYVSRGPEHFGYVVKPDGSHSSDLTLPIQMLLDGLR
ncbi:hypothetical protein [Verrucosispora sp. WMMD573]|uniref:TRAFAC clade GTPase domain-containing protein n=1 Tax=Verrucosispora sp. WMMD573 TaxID=3015149 RepID=UPI00248C715C|nr:hypothetical protein [Verrucosispora sp. WMMD573]WBB56031.1 hypothetical protein O7601_08155 [Verrucosispora sp. WMMD573]